MDRDAMPKPKADAVEAKKALAAEVREQLDNLAAFVMAGNQSKTIQAKLQAKEQELSQLEQDLRAIEARLKGSQPRVSENWIAEEVVRFAIY